jgi:superfamily II DNA/RNA helicase
MVVNFDVPIVQTCGWNEPDYKNFMHRVGLTGGFGRFGLVLTMVQKGDENEPEFVDKIAAKFDMEIKELKSFKDFKETYNNIKMVRASFVL